MPYDLRQFLEKSLKGKVGQVKSLNEYVRL